MRLRQPFRQFSGFVVGLMLLLIFNEGPLHAQTKPAAAAATPPELTKLETILTNMGYDPKLSSDGVTVTINSGKYYVNLVLSGDKTVVYAQIAYTIKPQQKNHIPWSDALHYNDTHQPYFAVSKDDQTISLNVNFPYEFLQPRVLQTRFQILESDADQFNNILNPDNWK